MAGKKRKRREPKVPDLGSADFECPSCRHSFSMPWLEIFELQEMTHGFVGFELQNEYVACPKCGANSNRESQSAYGETPQDEDDCPF